MTLNERESFLAFHYEQYLKENPNIDLVNAKYIYEYAHKNPLVEHLRESHFIVWQAAKTQAVPDKQSLTLTCAELKEAFDFGAPDGEKDQFQMETEMTITWLKDGYDGEGYYCWYSDLPEEGCIKLGKSESGVVE